MLRGNGRDFNDDVDLLAHRTRMKHNNDDKEVTGWEAWAL